MSNYKHIFQVTLSVILWFVSLSPAHAEPLSAQEIIQKSISVYSGDDSSSKLTFRFFETDEPERKLAYLMLWKSYKDDKNLDTKMLFFKEFPPDKKDVAFMTWLYKPELNKDDDQWLYLPELRTVRKLSKKMGGQHDGGHGHHKEDDEFSKSVMHRPHLIPRSPHMDELKLIKSTKDEDKDFYIIERSPKHHSMAYPYTKTVNRIRKDHLLLSHIDYYGMDGKLVLQQDFEWTQMGQAWVWKQAKATDVKTGNTTELSISDIKINIGIKDRVFTKRIMKLGPGGLRF